MKKNILALLIICTISTTECATLLFDLSEVLVYRDQVAMAAQASIFKVIRYGVEHFKGPHDIAAIAMDILSTYGAQESDKDHPIAMSHNRVLPKIWCDWQRGLITYEEIKNKALKKIKELEKKSYFASSLERELVEEAMDISFKPSIQIHYIKANRHALELLKKCHNKKTKSGAPEHTLMILANWDQASFDLLKEQPAMQELLKYFDEKSIILSSKLHAIKPHIEFYERAIKQYKLNPEECIVIDDGKENLRMAKKFGFKTIYVESLDCKNVELELKKLNVL